MKLRDQILFLLLGCTVPVLAGCGRQFEEIGREPAMSSVGSGIAAQPAVLRRGAFPPQAHGSSLSLWDDGRSELYRDASAKRVGDLVTVVISINDRASLGNSSGRSKEAKVKHSFDYLINILGLSSTGKEAHNLESTSSAKGEGTIDRTEKVQFTVAAIVTDILPNGNLVISGSQEIRVNFELRQLEVGGIVRPRDISRDNIVSYDKIAEARISYGGRGRQSDVQQPGWGHQAYDIVSPF